MFIGTYYHTLESKGRVSLPKAFRDEQSEWIVTRGLDGGLFVFRAEEFQAKLAELAQRPLTKKTHRDFIRYMANEAFNAPVDTNGRVQLPEYLINFAQLKKDIVVVGSINWIEIWDRDLYHQYRDSIEQEAATLAENLESTTHD